MFNKRGSEEQKARCAPMRHSLILALALLAARAGANPNLTPGVWTNISPPQAQYQSHPKGWHVIPQGVAVDPNNPSILYVTSTGWNDDTWATQAGAVFKSTDGGSTWTTLPQLDAPVHLRIDPNNGNHLYAADGVRGNTNGFWVSMDGGNSWTQPAGFHILCNTLARQGYTSFSDGYDVDVDPSNFSHILYSSHSCAQVVAESTDGGNTWTSHITPAKSCSGGFEIFFLYSPDLAVGNGHTWLFCTQGDGMWRTTDSGATWTRTMVNDMGHGSNQIYYTRAGVLFAGSQGSETSPGGPIRSTDNGATWQYSNKFGWVSMGITGDGTNLYTGPLWQASPVLTSPETDGLHWTPYAGDNSSLFGPFEMAFDKVNGILYDSNYSSSGELVLPGDRRMGLLALKIPTGGAPLTPGGLSASARSGRIGLSWNASSGATSFRVKRSTISGRGYVPIASPATTSFTDTGLANGTTYYCIVSAVNSSGEGFNSNQVSAIPWAGAPPAPRDLKARPGNTQVSLSWTASSGATSYNVLRSTINGSGYASAASGITATSYTDTGLINGTATYFVVTATNSQGTSRNSKQAQASPIAPVESPWSGSACGGPAWAIPGIIQAENYDCAGEGVAYHDSDTVNDGDLYRKSDGVDIDTCTDTGGGYYVAWTAAGEYLKYTVNVATAGSYNIGFRVAAASATGTFHLEDTNGTNLTGSVTAPVTGGWQTWTTVTVNNIALSAGSHTLKFVEETGNYNFNYMSFTAN